MPKRYLVHVVDDDLPTCEALGDLLRSAGYRVRTYPSADAFLAHAPGKEPGCVLSDVCMPGTDGVALVRRLREREVEMPVVLITGQADVSLAVAAMKAGAADFLEKPVQPPALFAAVDSALLRLWNAAAADRTAEGASSRLNGLTSREREVLEGLVAGDSNKQIAARLSLSPRTVEFHRARIMEKTGARRLPQLVQFWLSMKTPADSTDS